MSLLITLALNFVAQATMKRQTYYFYHIRALKNDITISMTLRSSYLFLFYNLQKSTDGALQNLTRLINEAKEKLPV
ncbi:MAG TPA: hypothetical protein VIM65_04695 [Cyclobacteriaceae bacterium]